MTWVVGGKHLFCARALSDIQVTLKLSDGRIRYIDGVQKTHRINSNIVILFANSIKLAFFVIEDLKKEFAPKIDERLYARPEVLMRKMARYIKFAYKKHCDNGENVEFLIFLAPAGAYTSFGVWKLASPAFDIIGPGKPFEMLELGSGSVLDDYREIVNRNSVGVYLIDNGEGNLPDAIVPVGRMALKFVFAEALEFQNAGISKAMHITLISHNNVYIQELPANPNVTFPVVATSWKELTEIVGKQGVKLGECLAFA